MAIREHLFRTKRADGGGLTYGVPLGDVMLSLDKRESGAFCVETPIDPETVCEFTGLTDKNGVKIFEGDIMKYSAYGKEYIGVVEIVNGSAGVTDVFIFNNSRESGACPYLDTAVFQYGATIIGNIFDNPELLEGDKNGNA